MGITIQANKIVQRHSFNVEHAEKQQQLQYRFFLCCSFADVGASMKRKVSVSSIVFAVRKIIQYSAVLILI